MASSAEWQGFSSFDATLFGLENYDPIPLLETWEDIIVEGNRRGVLAGVDGNNQPMPPLKYRNGAGKKTRNRQVPHFGRSYLDTPANPNIAFRPHAAGFDLNLTSAQYQELTGPRLAPRRDQSRVITHLRTAINHDSSSGTWEVIGAWEDVVSVKGVLFLPFHFDGEGFNPRYDLRPVRPEDLQFARNQLEAHARSVFFMRY
jgi:hypothetical protein